MENKKETSTKGAILSLILQEPPLVLLFSTPIGIDGGKMSESESQRKRRKKVIKSERACNYCISTNNQRLIDDQRKHVQYFSPSLSEFSFLFFGSIIHCRNSMRVSQIVSKFVDEVNCEYSTFNEASCVIQVVLVCPSLHELSHLAPDTKVKQWWYVLHSGHPCFNTLHEILAVRMTPCLFVINNKTGRVISGWGLEAIEYHQQNPQIVLQAWRRGEEGVSVPQKLMNSCLLS